MRTAVIVLKLAGPVPVMHADYIGVDRGTLALLKQNLPCTLAIGDFDSVNLEEMVQIENHAAEVIKLNPVKNDTDSEAALNEALKRGYDQIYLIGALGGRADHALINLRLVYQHPGKVILLDEQNRIEAYSAGVYAIKKENYAFIGFFTETEAEISLQDFKYPLTKQILTPQDLYTVSNELIEDTGTVTVHQGVVIVIQSKDQR